MWRNYVGGFTAKRSQRYGGFAGANIDKPHGSGEPTQHLDALRPQFVRKRSTTHSSLSRRLSADSVNDDAPSDVIAAGLLVTANAKGLATSQLCLAPSTRPTALGVLAPPFAPASIAASKASPCLTMNDAGDDMDAHTSRPTPEMPDTEGIEYPRAASWSSSTVAEILRDPIGKQVFRRFLFESLAEENLLFVEAIEQLQQEKDAKKIKQGLDELLLKYSSYINLSSVAMTKLREASTSDTLNIKSLDLAHKEISKLLENDQFPRFRRSKIYLNFLEQLLPRAYAEKWATSFDALLGNQVGRYHFRQYLFSVHAEENLRFWESVVEFKNLKNKSQAMLNMGRNIQQQFLREGTHNEVFLPFGLRQKIEKRIQEKEVDETLFEEAVKHVEQILKNDPYVRFLQSREYKTLLDKLH